MEYSARTKHQRHVLYQDILTLNADKMSGLEPREGGIGVCELAADLLYNNPYRYGEAITELPEFNYFDPGNRSFYWFGDVGSYVSKAGNDIRQLALMFCIEMTK